MYDDSYQWVTGFGWLFLTLFWVAAGVMVVSIVRFIIRESLVKGKRRPRPASSRNDRRGQADEMNP